jgi:hypothetical protein
VLSHARAAGFGCFTPEPAPEAAGLLLLLRRRRERWWWWCEAAGCSWVGLAVLVLLLRPFSVPSRLFSLTALSSPALATVLFRFLLFRLGFSSGYMQLHFNGFAKFHN